MFVIVKWASEITLFYHSGEFVVLHLESRIFLIMLFNSRVSFGKVGLALGSICVAFGVYRKMSLSYEQKHLD